MAQKLAADSINNGNTALGIEFGSTRIKAVLIGDDYAPLASGSHNWENQLENGVWTYSLEDVWSGLQECFRNLNQEIVQKFSTPLQNVGALGISAMMHGYLVFDSSGKLLTPYRTWRNTMTGEAASKLTELFQFNIPQRWSIAHLYQAILNKEAHVGQISSLTTLAGYVHWKLTGEHVVGIGEASGIFPIDNTNLRYDQKMVDLFDDLLEEENFPWRLLDILPEIRPAAEAAGSITDEGAKLLDPAGELQAGIPLCPPEGDAGTGMVATNSIRVRTGNVSAGTSVFAMIVLEKTLSRIHPEIDMVATPAGKPVAMVHSNNCTSDLNAWVDLFAEFTELLGVEISQSKLYELLYQQALLSEADGGGLLAFNNLSGEPITHLEKGRPLFVRTPESKFTLANFMRVNLFSALSALKIGLEILLVEEKVGIDQVLGHGGFFKTEKVGQQIMAAAMDVPVSVMKTAGEGGAWGIALLASYLIHKDDRESLEDYLDDKVFSTEVSSTVEPNPADITGFAAFIERYKKGLVIERAAVDALEH